MNRKVRLLAVISMAAIMASGCSSYRDSYQKSANASADSGGISGTGQVAKAGNAVGSGAGQVAGAGAGQVRGTSQQGSQSAVVDNNSCSICAVSKEQSTYTYKPEKAVVKAPTVLPSAPKTQEGQHNQQYYIDRWNSQQEQGIKPAQNTNYAGNGQNSTTYNDYSSAAGTTASNANSNKSIYTGSYQQEVYKPTTYSGGSEATTPSSGSNTYIVKKGDTVFEIMRQTGVYWKDIISFNNLQPPYNIHSGQTIRLK